MKVTLIHNPSAGDDSRPSADRLVEIIQSAGHKVKYQSIKEKSWKKALKKRSCDIIAIAGGDGTVGKVARRLVGSTVPMAILPVGTANNIGHAIGLTGRALEPLIAEWDTARRMSFDVGEVTGPWGSNYFVEGVGVGLFAATILSEQRDEPTVVTKSRREDEVTRVLQILKDRVEKHRPKKIKVLLDDDDLSDDYVLIQALNIRYAGPNLDLAPNADTNDGLLDVVLLRRGEEGKLRRYLTHCIKRKSAKANLIVRRARRLQIESNGFPVHIDDKARPISTGKRAAGSNEINLKVSHDAVIFLCPQKTRRRPQRQPAAKRG